MFSVILPTMWRGAELSYQLPLVLEHPLVGEVILIDNETKSLPDWFRNNHLSNSKITYLPQKQNIFVNPAWNLGAHVARYDNLCIMSDDTLFNTCVFDFLNDKLQENQGITGLYPKQIIVREKMVEPGQQEVSQPIESFLPIKETKIHLVHTLERLMPLGFSMLFFWNKKNWIPIPEDLKIYFGDTWLFYLSQLFGLPPRFLMNYPLVTRPYTTSLRDPELRAWKLHDNARVQTCMTWRLQELVEMLKKIGKRQLVDSESMRIYGTDPVIIEQLVNKGEDVISAAEENAELFGLVYDDIPRLNIGE